MSAVNEFMRTTDAARYLCVSRAFLEAARCDGSGPCFAKLGRVVIYRAKDLDEYAKARMNTSTHLIMTEV